MKAIIFTLVLCCIATLASAKSLTKQDSAFVKNVSKMDGGEFVRVKKTAFSKIYLTLAYTDYSRVYVLKNGFIQNMYDVVLETGEIIYYVEE